MSQSRNEEEFFLEEDFEFARRTEEAYKRHERGEFIQIDFDEFIEEMKKW